MKEQFIQKIVTEDFNGFFEAFIKNIKKNAVVKWVSSYYISNIKILWRSRQHFYVTHEKTMELSWEININE